GAGDAGRLSARFYSVNTLGAVCGAWLAGFYLVQNFGLVATLLIAGLANVTAGAIAIGWSRQQGAAPRAVGRPRQEQSSITTGVPITRACALVAMTGALAMGLEILASRGLALIFGSSLQAFALVLMAF